VFLKQLSWKPGAAALQLETLPLLRTFDAHTQCVGLNFAQRAGCTSSTRAAGSSTMSSSMPAWCGMRQLEVLKQVAITCKLYDRVQIELQSYGLLPPLRDIEIPLVGSGLRVGVWVVRGRRSNGWQR